MKRKTKQEKFKMILLLVLFCFSISIFNMAGYIFAAMVVFLFLFWSGKLKIGLAELALFVFSEFYFLFYIVNYGIHLESVILFAIGPWSAYLIGKCCVFQFESDHDFFMKFVVVLSVGMFAHGMLNWLSFWNSDYMKLYQFYRQSMDFWRGTIVNVNTTGMYYTFLTGLCIGVLFSTFKNKYKVLAIVVLVVSISATVFFANRTLLLIVAIIFGMRGVIWLFSKKTFVGAKVWIIFYFIILGIVIYCMIENNVWDLQNKILSLKLVQRIFDGNVTSRWDVWSVFVKDLKFIKYPYGGGFIVDGTSLNYLHNLWLDVYNTVGIFPFILLIVCTFIWCFDFCTFHKRMLVKKKENELIVIQCLIIAIVLNCMVEPIIEANPYYFLIIMMFLGAIKAKNQLLIRS